MPVTAAIIAEYNPFHKGHAYQIRKTREITGADHIVVIMSGDYVQRGKPAVMDKYLRTRMALEGGADLLFELPLRYATASAADFAFGACSILDRLGCIDYLSFGSEEGNLDQLQKAAELFASEPPLFSQVLKREMKNGRPYPAARAAAWQEYTDEDPAFLSEPNNILGISYLMALKKLGSSIKPVTLQRLGKAYHDAALPDKGTYTSAAAMRAFLEKACTLQKNSGNSPAILCTDQNPDTNSDTDTDPDTGLYQALSAYIDAPDSRRILTDEIGRSYPISAEDFWPMIRYRLVMESDDLESYVDMTPALAARIRRQAYRAEGYEDLAEAVKTREITRTRIDRALLHLLLDIKKDKQPRETEQPAAVPSYVRLLGMKRSHSDLLSAMLDHKGIPILTKAMPDILQGQDLQDYMTEIRAADLYHAAVHMKYGGQAPLEELRRPLICL